MTDTPSSETPGSESSGSNTSSTSSSETQSQSAASAPAESAPARLPTALVYDPACLDHLAPDGFPEVPERISGALARIEQYIAAGHLKPEQLLRLLSRPATLDELTTVHKRDYIDRLRRFSDQTMEGFGFDGEPRRFATDVYLSPGSYNAALAAAGGALVALDAIGEGQARNGYALVRPPGHHARPASAMGFCLFNNAAVAARYAQQRWGWQKVLIVDYDVHHGNGTQEMFYEDPDVVYFSTHEFPFYPGTGASGERGAGPGLGATVNVPLPAQSGWSVYDPIFRQVLWPVADKLKPDVILLSAGFDAHWTDPLADMRLSTSDFADLTLEVVEMADRYCDGRIVVVQEGGYNLEAVANCATTVLFGLTGSDAIADSQGEPEPLDFRWNEDAILRALYDLHDLVGYRRKARRAGVRTPPRAPQQ